MGLKDELRRLRAALRGQLDSFELADGSRYWYDPEAVGAELFLFGCACLRAGAPEKRPPPPPIVLALVKARDRRAAFASLAPAPFWPYESESFFERGELVHRSMIAGDVDGATADLSE